MRNDLNDILDRVKWCQNKTSVLALTIMQFVDTKPYKMWVDDNQIKGGFDHKIKFTEDVPSDISMDIGTIAHHLRASLDNLACTLAERNGRSSRSVAFPVCDTEEAYTVGRGAGRRKISKLSDEDKEKIGSFQPYVTKNNDLSILHKINVNDKHIRLATPIGMLSHVAINRLHGSLEIGGDVGTWGGLNTEKVILWTDAEQIEGNVGVKVQFEDIGETPSTSIDETLKRIAGTVEGVINEFA